MSPLSNLEIGPATLVNMLLTLAFWIAIAIAVFRFLRRRGPDLRYKQKRDLPPESLLE